MTNKEIAEAAGVSAATVARAKRKPDWPGDSDINALVLWIQAGLSAAGRKTKALTIKPTAAENGAMLALNLEYKRSQIEKNNVATHTYQQRAIKDYRQKMVKGCCDAMAIIFESIKALDLTKDEVNRVKAATAKARQHIKGLLDE